MNEIFDHLGFIDFFKNIVTNNVNIDKFYRFDLAEILKDHTENVSSEARNILVLERDEVEILGDDDSHLHQSHLCAFTILKVAQKGSQAYDEHDQIFNDTMQIGWSVIQQIKESYLKTLYGEETNGVTHFKVAGTKILKLGSVLGGRYGCRF